MQQFTGLEYLMIDMANHMGLNKSQFEKRIQWVKDNTFQLESLVDQADNPFQYAAAVMAYRKTQAGQPTGYLVEFDACSSGMQIMSAIMGCKIGATNTGLTGQVRQDVYSTVTKTINTLLNTNTVYDKDVIKTATMTVFYGSKAEPKNAFGEDTPELEAFYTALEMVAPGAVQLMPIMLNAWQSLNLAHTCLMPDGFFVYKKVKDSIDTKIEVDTIEGHPSFIYRHTENIGAEEGVSLAADIVHSIDGFIVREINYRCNYNRSKLLRAERMLYRRVIFNANTAIGPISKIEQLSIQHNFISLVQMKSLTLEEVNTYSYKYAYKLLQLVQDTLGNPSFPVIFIHDGFKTHPNYMNYIRQTYINILAELADSNIINTILHMITGKEINIPKLSDDLSIDIRDSNYALS